MRIEQFERAGCNIITPPNLYAEIQRNIPEAVDRKYVFGMDIVYDAKMPPDRIEFRDRRTGELKGVIILEATDEN